MNATGVMLLFFLWVIPDLISAVQDGVLFRNSKKTGAITTLFQQAENILLTDTTGNDILYVDSAYMLAVKQKETAKLASANNILKGLKNHNYTSNTTNWYVPTASEIRQSFQERQHERNRQLIYITGMLALICISAIFLYMYFRTRYRTSTLLRALSSELSSMKSRVTETNEKLASSEARYNGLLEKSPTGILLINRKGRILEVNSKMIEILGSPGPQETKKINCLEFPPLKAVGLSKNILMAIETGESHTGRVAYQSKWDRNLHLSYTIAPIKDKDGMVDKLLLNVEDMTDLILAERLRLESELKYHILVENSLQAMMIIQSGRVLFANMKMQELTLYSVEEIRNAGNRWLNLIIHPDDKRRSYKHFKGALSGEKMETNQVYKIIRKDGEIRIMETLSSVVNILDHPAMLIVAIDITEPVSARDNLLNSQRKLKELNAMKDKFFSIIAHDLKNPFSSILGFSNLLYEGYDNFSEKQRKAFIKNICEASENTFKLLQNLLEWSRTQTGKIGYSPDEIDLEALIMDNVSILNSGFVRKNIGIEVIVPERTSVYADENMVKLVLRNLISNALKFTPPGGKVILSAEKNSAETTITVKDNGVGIDKKNLRRLFRIDDQLKTKGTENESGSGLGLILCKEFVERNKGRIWVHSRSGMGSSFSFSLPNNIPSKA